MPEERIEGLEIFNDECLEECRLLRYMVVASIFYDGIVYEGDWAKRRLNNIIGDLIENGALEPHECEKPDNGVCQALTQEAREFANEAIKRTHHYPNSEESVVLGHYTEMLYDWWGE